MQHQVSCRRDFLVCTNSINYEIAKSLLITQRLINPWFFVDTKRCHPTHLQGVQQWKLSVSRWRLLNLLLLIPGYIEVGNVYIPHHKINYRSRILTERAKSLQYLDDGLDTRRHTPINLDLQKINDGDIYYTFKEYVDFPDWMRRLEVRQLSSLHSLSEISISDYKSTEYFDHLFIESTGCKILDIIRILRIDPNRSLIIRHPSPAKRQSVGAGLLTEEGKTTNADRFVKCLSGKCIYFGETMSFFIAIAGGVHLRNSVYLAVSRPQKDNLYGLPVMESVFESGEFILMKVKGSVE